MAVFHSQAIVWRFVFGPGEISSSRHQVLSPGAFIVGRWSWDLAVLLGQGGRERAVYWMQKPFSTHTFGRQVIGLLANRTVLLCIRVSVAVR